MTESEAHRYMQKCSMDSGTNLVETAQMVLDAFDRVRKSEKERHNNVQINDNYLKLPGSYLFSTIAKKVAAYTEANPDAKIIRLGIAT